MPPLQPGDPAPLFTATNQSGETIRLADYLGRHTVVLFFYPKDGTLICTKEACAFRDSYEDFVRAGAVVIGISHDSEASHRNFADQQRLPFQLIADPDGSIRTQFGVPKTFWLLPGRVTYVIDRQGIIRHIFNSQFSADRHVSEALKIVRTLSSESNLNR
jgi:peroxiredoxin Q/BCP